jgi:hypothetical protein
VLGWPPGDPAVLRQTGSMGETAFYPFLSGRDNLPRWPGGVGSAITEWTWCSDKSDWPNAPGTPWPGYSCGMRQRLGAAAAAALRPVSPCSV